MALGIYFAPASMSSEQLQTVHEQLAAAGQDRPPGRTVHAAFRVGDSIHVFDVWQDMASFEAFGAHLMPILARNGVDPGEPRISEIELLMTAA